MNMNANERTDDFALLRHEVVHLPERRVHLAHLVVDVDQVLFPSDQVCCSHTHTHTAHK